MVVSAQPEKRLLWHPRVSNRFAVGGGGQITLYELHPDHSETKIKHVTSQQELQLMKCFQWSPHTAFDDLMAIGLSNGKVDLIRLEATNAGSNNVYTSGPSVTLPLRNSRACNTLAFSQADPNYLAVGLDKVRSDCSLVIWDVTTVVPALTLPTKPDLFEAAETLSSNALRLPRGDVGHRADTRMLQQYAPTEIVSSLSFLPMSSHLLFAGISHRWLRLFDLRSALTVSSVPTKAHAIATDPFDPCRLATIGDGTVSVWDRRKLSNPTVTFSEREAIADGAKVRNNAVYSEVEFSSTRRGTLATLEKDAAHVRFWDLLDIQPKAGSDERMQARESSRLRIPRKSWTNLPWVTSGPQAATSATHESESSVVLCNTRKTKSVSPPLASFALVPSSETNALTSNVMMVTQTGALELYAVHDTPKQSSWSSRCDLLIGTGRSLRPLPAFKAGESVPEPWESVGESLSPGSRARSSHSQTPSLSRGRLHSKGQSPMDEEFPALAPDKKLHPNRAHGSRNVSGTSKSSVLYHFDYSRGNDRRSRSTGQNHEFDGGHAFASARGQHMLKHPIALIQRVVEEDISNLMRSRVIHGYGLGKNNLFALLETHAVDSQTHELVDLWAWINYSREFLCEPTPLINGYDCSNQGLLGIWGGFDMNNSSPPSATFSPRSPGGELFDDNGLPVLTSHRKKRRGSAGHERLNTFNVMLQTLIGRRNNEPVTWKPTIQTSKLLQRQVALQLCGWSLQEEELMAAVKRWEEEGKVSRAVCWLVFTKKYTKAIELLMKSKDESHHLMSGTLAALIPSGASRNTELREHCQRLIIRLQDAYFRAILTHLTSGDWTDILEEENLPFRERLAIAFQFLDDKAVTSYLRTCVDKSCARGHIDILLVTGLTSKAGMETLQSYVDSTGDVQTAAILSSFVSPHKIPDRRAERWVEAYRDFLDGLRLFHHRVAFDIQRGQIIQESILSGAGNVSHSWAELPSILIRCNYCNKSITLASTDMNKSTTCPNCSKSLPRCAICLMSLGIVQDNVRNALLTQGRLKDPVDDAIVICQTCRHGGHASHILNWFYLEDGSRAHETCPVADCNCRCAD